MLSYCHRIADINFASIINRNIPRIGESRFSDFAIKKCKSPDITQKINIIENGSNKSLSEYSQNLLKTKFNFSERDLRLPVIKCAKISRKLDEVLCNPAKINIVKVQNFLRIYNFVKNTLDLFIYGGKIYFEKKYYPSEYYIAANLRIIFSSFLTSFSAIMLHCSGLIMKSGAALFFAPNEGGKSTVVRLSNNKFPILNDDQVIIKNEIGGIYAHGTPFGALNSGPVKAKVAGIFFLEQANFFRIEPISPLEIIECIWSEHLRYTFFLPVKQRQIAFNILYDAFHQVPIYKMSFKKESIDWDAIDKAMNTR